MPKTIAILGASGNIGSLATEYFARHKDEVIAYGRTEPGFTNPRVSNQSINYQDYSQLKSVFEMADVVIILVGFEYRYSVWKHHWPAFAQLLKRVIKETKTRTIFLDNVYPYGFVLGKMTEETKLKPSSKKGEIRTIVDNVFLRLAKQGYPVVIARSADFYGPGVTTSLMSQRFHDLIKTKRTFEWIGDPTKLHTFTFVPDIPPALYALAHSQTSGVYHLPTSNEPITGELIQEILEDLTDSTLTTRTIGIRMVRFLGIFMGIMRELSEMMYQYENHYIFDSQKILDEFPQLTVTSIKDGITLQYQHYSKD
jgi:nucleoside-diphosphate-sugar epimerase